MSTARLCSPLQVSQLLSRKGGGGGVVTCVSHQKPYRRPGDPATQAGLLIFWLLASVLDVLCRRFIVILASFGGSRLSRSFTAARFRLGPSRRLNIRQPPPAPARPALSVQMSLARTPARVMSFHAARCAWWGGGGINSRANTILDPRHRQACGVTWRL